MSTIATNRYWTNFTVDRRNLRCCHLTFDRPPIKRLRRQPSPRLSDPVGLIEKLNHFRPSIQLNRKSDLLNAASEDTQAAFADAVNIAAFF
jgi:hypothetical protein